MLKRLKRYIFNQKYLKKLSRNCYMCYYFINSYLLKKIYVMLIHLYVSLVSFVRSSRPEVFCKKGVLRNFAKFTGKHLCQGLFFNKKRCFPVNFAKFLRTPFLTEHLQWLLLFVRSMSFLQWWLLRAS